MHIYLPIFGRTPAHLRWRQEQAIRRRKMGPIKLDPQIMNTMEKWGGNYQSTVGDNHNGVADKIDSKIDSKDITLNKMSEMDASHAKPSADNPGFDRGFWAKADPLQDTTGHGKLTRKLKD